MDEKEKFRDLLARLRNGEEQAMSEFENQFAGYIRAAVRRKLHEKLRTQYDSLDFVQDVWASFLKLPDDRIKFDSPAAMVAFLKRVAENKVQMEIRDRFERQKHNINREYVLEENESLEELAAVNTTPSQWAIEKEEWQRVVADIPPGHRSIADRIREGYSVNDIVEMTNISESTVKRVVSRLREKLGM